MPTNCIVKFDKPCPIYYAGDEVSGTVHLCTTSEKTIKGIEIKILGYGSVWFLEGKVWHLGEEKFLDLGEYVLGRKDGQSFPLKPGSYSYNFKNTIPLRVPTSFEGQHGVIRYIVYVKIKRFLIFDYIFKEPFVIILPLDLNFDAILRMPKVLETSKTFVFLCHKSDPLKMKLSIPMLGYVPGQTIYYKIIIENEADIDINNIFVGLIQNVTYISKTPKELQSKTNYKIIKKEIGPILKCSQKEIRDSFIIPPVPTSTMDTSRLISIQYYIYLKAKGGWFHNDLSISIPLIIGAIPLQNIQIQQNPAEYFNSNQQKFEYDGSLYVNISPVDESTSPVSSNASRPQIVFKEAVKLCHLRPSKDQFDGLDQVRNYTIMYPVYENLTTPFPPGW